MALDPTLAIAIATAASLAVCLVVATHRSRRSRRDLLETAAGLTRERDRLRAELAAADAGADARHAAEAQLSALVSGAPLTLFTVDRAGVLTAIEGEGSGWFGPGRPGAVGWSAQDVFRDAPGVVQGIEQALAGTRTTGSAEVAGRSVAVQYAPLRSAKGALVGAIGVALDVTEAKRTEEKLDQQAQLAQALVDAQSDLGDLVVVAEEGQIVYVNDAAAAVTGYDHDELVGRTSLDSLATPEERDRIERERAARRADEVTRFDTSIRTKGGTMIDLELAETEVSIEGRRHVVTIGRDITERRRADRERQELVSRLLGAEESTRKAIAQDLHDDAIQTLFAALLRLRLLEAKITDPAALASLEQLAAIIDRSIHSLRHLLFDLWPAALERDGLAGALRLYLDELREQTGILTGVQDDCDVPPDPETATILYRIAQEALANVRKHAGATRVDVTLEEGAGGVHLTVRDDGRGFEVEETPAHRPGHVGVAAMRERAQLAQGRLTISSAPGGGTTIEVWIPRQAGKTSADQPAA